MPGDQVVEVGEQLVGRQVEVGEVVHRGAQPAHGGRGVQAVADDVADDQGDPGAGQRDDVEPVAAHPGLRGQVAGGDLDGGLLGQAAGQQAALEGHGRGVLAGVAAGVVDADRGPGGELLGEGQVVVVEGLGRLRPPEVGHAQDDAAGLQRHRDQRVDAVCERRRSRPSGSWARQPSARVQVGLEDRVPPCQARTAIGVVGTTNRIRSPTG